jgi:hypothetical protein
MRKARQSVGIWWCPGLEAVSGLGVDDVIVASLPRKLLMVKNGMNVVAKIHWRTLIAALGIGLVVELLLVRLYLWYLPGALAASQNGRTNLWLWEAIRLTQQPGLGLVQSWVGVVRPGYAELIGDMFLVPVIQWVVYAGVIYLILEMYLRKNVRATLPDKD